MLRFFPAILILLSGLGFGMPAAGQSGTAAKPDLVLRKTIRYTDYHHLMSIPFDVPAGTVRISMRFSYTGQEQRTALDMGIQGPEGFRGWSGGDKDGFTLSLADATPSYLPGPISPGRWRLLLGVPNIRPGVVSEFSAQVYFDRSVAEEMRDPLLQLRVRSGPGWYRGDLHMHTAHSDGACKSQNGRMVPCPLFRTVEDAAARGLDFIAITDHNTESHYDDERELQPYFDRVLLMPGREITTYQGHANLFGTTRFLDFRIGTDEVPNLNAMLRRVSGLGGIISINHPAAPSGENCMGCGWLPESTVDYHLIQAVEVVNGRNADGARSGVGFWEKLLNEGNHLTAIGGSDNHDADIAIPGPGSIGYPTTVVYADNLSTPAILDGIRAGHVFVDTEGTRDRLLEYSATAGGHTAMMGDALEVKDNASIHISVHVKGADGARLALIADGVEQPATPEMTIHGNDVRTALDVAGSTAHMWIRLEVRNDAGHRLLIGNPVYLSH
ncbi:CehA/McbA family metallohydrolase [Paracidobacterium acidisoli]|uniref:PHP domain-containing protein n=1 Tax=Paracidobacterium acidisoli TaxID=2303751 RepID=A0A372IV28_9BACT|nr:CehA/McbA family metallohydrolase [Paracidobacterium acidisoli]MBT9330115.1 CehA/McbA family metallohydrolase [Paracidobacterium acidisoli]